MKKIGSKHAATENRKKEIIRAALECFTEAGIQNTSISEICQKSKASTGSVYHHFGSKEKLATAVYLEGIAAYQEGFVKALESPPDARGGIFGIISYHLEWVETHTRWATFIVRERHAPFMGEHEDELNRLNREFGDRLAGWFKRHIKAGTIRRMTPALYQAILMGPVQEYMKNHILYGRASGHGAVAEQLGHAAWAALKTPETA